eukprot:403338630
MIDTSTFDQNKESQDKINTNLSTDEDIPHPQFNYLNLNKLTTTTNTQNGDHIKTMELASEQILKDIGVDIEKFLSPQTQQDFNNYRDQYTTLSPIDQTSFNDIEGDRIDKLSGYRNPLMQLPSLDQLSQPSPALTQINNQKSQIQSNYGNSQTYQISTATGKVQTPQTLEMKYKQMKYSKPMPTDQELEEFQESHKRRMLRIEERFQRSLELNGQQSSDNNNVKDSIEDVVLVSGAVEKFDQESIEENNSNLMDEQNQEKMFTKTIRAEFNFTAMPPPTSKPKLTNNQLHQDRDDFQENTNLENDMQLEDLSDCDEITQTNNNHQATLKLVQKSREQQDQEYQLKAMKALIDRDIKNQSQQKPVKESLQQNIEQAHGSAIQQQSIQQDTGSDDEDGFDNINAILESKETKAYELNNESSIFSSLQKSNAILIDQQDQDSEKFRGFMSWASDEKQKPSQYSNSNITNNQKAQNDNQMPMKNNEACVNKFIDPFMLLMPNGDSNSQILLEQLKLEEQMFKYNEHGIYSDQSEDEESSGLQGTQNGLRLSKDEEVDAKTKVQVKNGGWL